MPSAATWRAAWAGRWIARVAGALMVLFLLAFVAGEGPPPLGQLTGRENLFAVGLACLYGGLIVAWLRPRAGGLLSLAGWAVLWTAEGRPAWDVAFSVPAAVAALHLLCWWGLRGPAPPYRPLRRAVTVTLWTSAAVFVLLCANEILGLPPLMATPRRPPQELVGTWTASLPGSVPAVFVIAADGSVSGTVGPAAIVRARYLPNRTWFGRLIGWRTAWLVRGELTLPVAIAGAAGDRISVPLNPRATGLSGALFLSRPGPPKPVTLALTPAPR